MLILSHYLEQFSTQFNELADDPDYPELVIANFTQKLDHFDPYSTATWNQKYYYNPKFYRGHGIVFLMIGGEGPESKKWTTLETVQYLQWAKEYGAAVFDLEHRFFGDSFPIPNMSTDTLQLLTTEQALADLANFIIAMNQQYNFPNPRWVTFGGSYPGSLSAWFRAKYPHLTVGAVASSAPINLKLDYYGRFNLQPKFDKNTTKLDITNFFANLYNVFQGMTQYTYDGRDSLSMNTTTLRVMCNIMTDSKTTDPAQRVANMFFYYNNIFPMGNDPKVMYNNYWDIMNWFKSGDLKVLGEDGKAMRGWMWLCCNELGFLQTTDQGRNSFGSTVPLNYFIDMCTDMFGDNINMDYIYTRNIRAQNFYGGSNHYADFNNASNVVLPNGSLDPWHALGTYINVTARNVIPVLINGTAHCSDMYPSYAGEPSDLTRARAIIKSSVESFITSSFYDPYNHVSYVEINKRKRGDFYERRHSQKLENRTGKPPVKRLYVKRNGDEKNRKPKLFVWRVWQSPSLKNLLEDVGPYVGLDDGAVAIYDTRGNRITSEDDLIDNNTYYVTAPIPQTALDLQTDTVAIYTVVGIQMPHVNMTMATAVVIHIMTVTLHSQLRNIRTRGTRYMIQTRRRSDDKLQKQAKIKRNKKKSITPKKIREIFKGPNQDKVPEAEEIDEYKRYYRDAVAMRSTGYSRGVRRSRSTQDYYRDTSDYHNNDHLSSSDFHDVDAAEKDRRAIEKHRDVFLNGQGMECQCINFNRKQLEKGMHYTLELIARRFNVNPGKLCDMDGRKMSEVSDLMSRGSYILVPVGQSFRDTWYFLPDNAIDTSSSQSKIDERSAQRDRLIQRKEKKLIKGRNGLTYTASGNRPSAQKRSRSEDYRRTPSNYRYNTISGYSNKSYY
ncbi:hypothetical protein WR25_26512 [Diploscapter pachys]|uniref:Doublecortin domain-containing protein n=1 Tax=Diploscapter pachys TaxID=2018661 RepID=A0A2A2LIC4_9BILA|nr:hypothetical protein WR25_26512 [Diploscapter pachys]